MKTKPLQVNCERSARGDPIVRDKFATAERAASQYRIHLAMSRMQAGADLLDYESIALPPRARAALAGAVDIDRKQNHDSRNLTIWPVQTTNARVAAAGDLQFARH
jgi:hypothetical protein